MPMKKRRAAKRKRKRRGGNTRKGRGDKMRIIVEVTSKNKVEYRKRYMKPTASGHIDD